MINRFYGMLTQLVDNYSIKVNKGDRVFIGGPALAKEQLMYVDPIQMLSLKEFDGYI